MSETVVMTTVRAELYLCLARAIVAPRDREMAAAMIELLPEDLGEIANDCPEAISRPLQHFADALRGAESGETLQRHWSRLFFVPPVRVPLSAGVWLDGSTMGQSSIDIESLYARYGVGRSEGFRDLPDHLGMLLEFVGYLYANAAEAADKEDASTLPPLLSELHETLSRYLQPWLSQAQARLQQEEAEMPEAALWTAFFESLNGAVNSDLATLAVLLPPPPVKAADPAAASAIDREALRALHAASLDGGDGTEKTCKQCGSSFLPEQEIARIIASLEQAGLGSDHLKVCPACRVSDLGLRPMKPVTLGKHGI